MLASIRLHDKGLTPHERSKRDFLHPGQLSQRHQLLLFRLSQILPCLDELKSRPAHGQAFIGGLLNKLLVMVADDALHPIETGLTVSLLYGVAGRSRLANAILIVVGRIGG